MSYTQQHHQTEHSQEEGVTESRGNHHPGSNSDAISALRGFQPTGVYSGVFEDHFATQNNLRVQLSQAQLDSVEDFQEHYKKHRKRYEGVSGKTDIPAALIAAIHWRESTGDFSTYLHQGDPLGRKAVNEPKNIPVFHKWENAAVHALQMKAFLRDNIGIDSETRDLAALATFSEAYNGLGYHLYKGMESPYVYAGTSAYSRGKYVGDGDFSSHHIDQQPGIVPLLGAVNGVDSPTNLSPRVKSDEDKWLAVVDGHDVLRSGSHGAAVEVMQRRLSAIGFPNSTDGDFGPNTKSLVIQFQERHQLNPDGIVGRGTAGAIESAFKSGPRIE